jgi:hypothetical protein
VDETEAPRVIAGHGGSVPGARSNGGGAVAWRGRAPRFGPGVAPSPGARTPVRALATRPGNTHATGVSFEEAPVPSIRSGIAAAAIAAGISVLAAGPAEARASVGFFIGAGPPVFYAPPPPPPLLLPPPPAYVLPPAPYGYYPPPPPPVFHAPPVPRFYYAPPPAYRYWPY